MAVPTHVSSWSKANRNKPRDLIARGLFPPFAGSLIRALWDRDRLSPHLVFVRTRLSVE